MQHWTISSAELDMRLWLYRSGNLPVLRIPLTARKEESGPVRILNYCWIGKTAAAIAFGPGVWEHNLTWYGE